MPLWVEKGLGQPARENVSEGIEGKTRRETRLTAVEVDTRDVLLDGQGRLDGELRIGRAELVDEVGLLNRMRPPDRSVRPNVVDEAGVLWRGVRGSQVSAGLPPKEDPPAE